MEAYFTWEYIRNIVISPGFFLIWGVFLVLLMLHFVMKKIPMLIKALLYFVVTFSFLSSLWFFFEEYEILDLILISVGLTLLSSVGCLLILNLAESKRKLIILLLLANIMIFFPMIVFYTLCVLLFLNFLFHTQTTPNNSEDMGAEHDAWVIEQRDFYNDKK